ncbi:MAG TPA: hypothetical protein VER96_39700 [Polyangiaceae bacterium]|nr:hypothetical protein [Polyangiaceae bacterium]
MQIQSLAGAASLLLAFFVNRECLATPHARDGFYLSLGSGLGAEWYASTAHNSFYDPSIDYTNHQSGPVATLSLMLGLPLRPGLALGVGGLTSAAWLSSPKRTMNGEHVSWEDGGGPYVNFFAMAGAFVDYYPRRELGWHVQALAGYAALAFGDFSDEAPGGLGLMAGVGHDWWVSNTCSAGFLARLSYANMHAKGAPYSDGHGGSSAEHDTVVSPTLEASFTCH